MSVFDEAKSRINKDNAATATAKKRKVTFNRKYDECYLKYCFIAAGIQRGHDAMVSLNTTRWCREHDAIVSLNTCSCCYCRARQPFERSVPGYK